MKGESKSKRHNLSIQNRADVKTKPVLLVLAVLICFTVICSATYAYFADERTSSVAPITAASYELKVCVGDDEIGLCNLGNENVEYICPLAENDMHLFNLSAVGNAKKGYCIITIGDKTYVTTEIVSGCEFSLYIQAAAGDKIIFSRSWGNYDEGGAVGNGGSILSSVSPHEEYTVEEGVTLEMIAEYYGVDVSDILVYNGIGEISVGEAIKVPNPNVSVAFMRMNEPGDDDKGTGSEGENQDANTEDAVSDGLGADDTDDNSGEPVKSDTVSGSENKNIDSETTEGPGQDGNLPKSGEDNGLDSENTTE